ncbi:MAG: hypothetical protein NC131_02260 [Roseburia sp.]|nr:hypothetical protein [Roseburia sp.]
MNNKFIITDNICVSEALVYICAILFFIAVFPVHVIGYVYISTAEKYASLNVTVYRLFTLLNVNTAKPPQADGEERNDNGEKGDEKDGEKFMTPANWLEMFNNLCITKIVQLGDYGIQNPNNAYVALANCAVTDAVYTFVKLNGGKTKLKNYSVLNYEHANVNYYLKLAGIINVITLLKLITIFYWGKINEN